MQSVKTSLNNVEEAAEKTIYLLEHSQIAKKMDEKGREHVRENFLITRHLEDYLKLFSSFTD